LSKRFGHLGFFDRFTLKLDARRGVFGIGIAPAGLGVFVAV
jgi:hypothetical protein